MSERESPGCAKAVMWMGIAVAVGLLSVLLWFADKLGFE